MTDQQRREVHRVREAARRASRTPEQAEAERERDRVYRRTPERVAARRVTRRNWSPERKAAVVQRRKDRLAVRTVSEKEADQSYLREWHANRSSELVASGTASRKKWHDQNRVEYNAVLRAKRATRAPERVASDRLRENAYMKAWYAGRTPDQKAYTAAKTRHTRSMKLADFNDGTLSVDDCLELWATATHCPDCGVVLAVQAGRAGRGARGNKSKAMDHIVPLTRAGWHSIDNARTICRKCNTGKMDRLPAEWLAWVAEKRGYEQAILCRRSMLKNGQLGRGGVPAVDVAQLMEAV